MEISNDNAFDEDIHRLEQNLIQAQKNTDETIREVIRIKATDLNEETANSLIGTLMKRMGVEHV